MMKLRRNNFTSSVPAGSPPSSPQPVPAKPLLHEAEITARVFRINYAILCVVLLPVTVAAAFLLEFEDISYWLVLYGGCCLAAYYWLHARHYPQPVLSPASSVIRVANPNAAKVTEQVQRHSQPQHHSNRLANYAPVTDDEVTQFDREELAPPVFMTDAQTIDVEAYVDVVRDAVLNLLIMLYKKDEGGALINIKADGTLQDGIIVPWSKRGGLTEGQRRQALDLLDQVRTVGGWLIRYDDASRKWKLNVALYSTFDAACDILDKCPTRVA